MAFIWGIIFFLYYEWFLQNLRKDIIRTNMHTTVWKTSVSWTDTETLLGLHKKKLPEILNSITQRKLLSISNTISNIIVPTSPRHHFRRFEIIYQLRKKTKGTILHTHVCCPNDFFSFLTTISLWKIYHSLLAS